MPDLLRKNLSSIQENLMRSLMMLNESGHLTHLIKEIGERKIDKAADVFILISLCISSYPEIINHLQRQNLENLYDECFSKVQPQELFDILEKPINDKVKELLYAYIERLVNKYKMVNKKTDSKPAKHLLELLAHHITSNYQPQNKNPPRLVQYLLDDYIHFVSEAQKMEKANPRKLR